MAVVDSAARVLAINVARIGDTLLATPALRALKHALPDSHLTVLAHPARRDVLAHLTFIDALSAITAKTAWYRGRFQSPRWDLAVVYGHDAPLLRYAARVAKRVVAFDQQNEALNKLLWKAVPRPTETLHAVHERLLLPAAIGAETSEHRLAYAATAPETKVARHWLSQQAGGERPVVGFQVASFPTKRYRDWPLEKFIEIGRRILSGYPAARILVLGDGESRAPARALVQALGARVIPLAGQLRLRETAALMALLDLYVGVDTGPTHLAGALRVPMVALYHCRHRGRHLAPLQHDALRVIEHPATDADCGATRPMADIAVDDVWHAVESLLGRPR